MLVSEAIGVALARVGVGSAFGVAGSSNLLLINAMRDEGVAYYAACHEAGAVAMADGYARISGGLGVATVHQGPGFTNTLTALAEAVKSASPVLILAPETSARGDHRAQALDQGALARSVGAKVMRLRDPSELSQFAATAVGLAGAEQHPVVLTLPGDLLMDPYSGPEINPRVAPAPAPGAVSGPELEAISEAFARARRPLIVAGRGAVVAGAGPALRRLAESAGALLATTVVAKGLFAGDPFTLDFLGGLASPIATELAEEADLVLGFGTSFDAWTTCGGRIPRNDAELVIVDRNRRAPVHHQGRALGVVGDAAVTAEALVERLRGDADRATWRTPELAADLAAYRRADDWTPTRSDRLDPHALTIALNALLPRDRIVALDSGHFLAFPSMYVDSPDGRSFLFAQGFQSVGLGLGIGIGAAAADRSRVVAAMIGDGGAKMSLLELETAVRHSLRLAVIVFDDGGYGAEVHDFEPLGVAVDVARFPSRDYAAVARGLGADAVTITSLEQLDALSAWCDAPDRPLVLDCKVDPAVSAAAAMTEQGAAEWSLSIPALSG